MPESPRYTVRLPASLDARVQERVQATGIPFAALVRDALTAYLAADTTPTLADSTDRLQRLDIELDQLRARVAALELLLTPADSLLTGAVPTTADSLPTVEPLTGTDSVPTPALTAADTVPTGKPTGRPGISHAQLQVIADERTLCEGLSMADFAQRLFDKGLYRARSRDGREVPVDHSRLRRWLAQARDAGLL